MIDDIGSAINGASQILDLIRTVSHDTASSLPERAKQASIVSRIYIDRQVAEEDIVLPLIGTLNQMYAAYVITALGLEGAIDETRSVGEITRLIATESLIDNAALAEAQFGKLHVAMEGLGDLGDEAKDYEDAYKGGKPNKRDYSGSTARTSSSQVIDLTGKEQRLVSGRVIEMQIPTPKGAVTIRMYMQLVPRIVEGEVAGAFVGFNAEPSILRRLRQVKVGEIRFFRDFIFAVDQVRRLKEALRKDKSGELNKLIASQSNALVRYWLNLTKVKENYNSASSVLIISKDRFERELAEGGVRFDEKMQRKFFNRSFMMMLVVVDSDYNTVDIFTHGIKGYGSYSFQAIEKVGDAKGNGMDLKDVMAVFGKGNSVTRF